MNIIDDMPEMEPQNVDQGNNVAAFRRFRGYNQKELAAKLKISQQEMSNLERMKIVPEDKLMQIAQVLNIDIDILKNFTTDCKITIINENEVTANDTAVVELGNGTNENTNNYYADKALETQQQFVEYLKGEIKELKDEIDRLRMKD